MQIWQEWRDVHQWRSWNKLQESNTAASIEIYLNKKKRAILPRFHYFIEAEDNTLAYSDKDAQLS